MTYTVQSIEEFVDTKNSQKRLFTPGPASLCEENIIGLSPCFGRGDLDYENTEVKVLKAIKTLSGQANLVRLQGSASLAIEIAICNFVQGNVLVISTGFYSQRLIDIISHYRSTETIKSVSCVNWTELANVSGHYDWILCCYTETSIGLKLLLDEVHDLARRCDARLFVDATASIGLEDMHYLADVTCFSSCKGLFGLTGASFIGFNDLDQNRVNSFYMNIDTHRKKLVTGPYHAIGSLELVLENYEDFKYAVARCKSSFMDKFGEYTPISREHQPLLCTYLTSEITTADVSSILYEPRSLQTGSVVCHLGEVHLRRKATGTINQQLRLSDETYPS